MEDGIERFGNADKGECGIVIDRIDFSKSGIWKCEVMRKRRPGSSRIGTVLYNIK